MMAVAVVRDKGCRPCSMGPGALHKQPLILDDLWTIIIHMLQMEKENQTVEGHACSYRRKSLI